MRTIALSLGGTKLRIASVLPTGTVSQTIPTLAWRERFGLEASRLEDGDRLVQKMVMLVFEEWQRVNKGEVQGIGLATKGPLEPIAGELILGPGQQTENMPFLDYPIARRLRECLSEQAPHALRKAIALLRVSVLHDGAAAVLGEVSPGGSFPGERDASAVIIGTGIGLGVVKEGSVYTGDGSPMTNVFGSLGRHLVRCSDARADYSYQYRGIKEGTRAPLDAQAGECFFSDRLSGPALAELVAESLLADAASVIERLTAMELGHVPPDDVKRLAGRTRRDRDKMKSLEARLLAGLTAGARAGNLWCRRKIEECGTETGRALSAFVGQFEREQFTRRIALVSTVAENLGLGVIGQETNDLFLEAIRRALAREDVNVIRSRCVDRELVAFTPPRRQH